MKIFIITTVRTTTTQPYTQLPRDRIELRLTHRGMLFLPKNAELEADHPNFCKTVQTAGINLCADPAQVDVPLLAALRERVGIRIETDDITEAAALLDPTENDPIFTAKQTQTKV
jgi:hypothetical protein